MENGKLFFNGIFCVTASLAYSVLRTLHKLNQKVPDDVQVIGFDGTRHFGDMDYTCSTIVQPVHDIAEMCVGQRLFGDGACGPPKRDISGQYQRQRR